MRSVARYPEVRNDGSMWVPLAPPPAPTYRQLSDHATGIIGGRAVVAYSTEWVLDLRILSEPYEEHAGMGRWVAQLCAEEAWHDYVRNDIPPKALECIIASVSLIFIVEDAW